MYGKNMKINDDKIFCLKIGEINLLKIIVENISEVAYEMTWTIHNPKHKEIKFCGVKIRAMDPYKGILINIRINIDKFVEFNCKHEIYEMCMDTEELVKFIKNIKKYDITSMYVKEIDDKKLIPEK